MDKKQISLLVLALVLIGAIIYLSRDWFAPADIQIGSTIRHNPLSEKQQARLGPAVKKQPYTVSFFFDRKCELQSIKVVQVREIETNKFAHPLWALVSSSNSIPVKNITYGIPVRGLQTAVKGDQAAPLLPGVPYRLIVQTKDQTATHDFTLGRKQP